MAGQRGLGLTRSAGPPTSPPSPSLGRNKSAFEAPAYYWSRSRRAESPTAPSRHGPTVWKVPDVQDIALKEDHLLRVSVGSSRFSLEFQAGPRGCRRLAPTLPRWFWLSESLPRAPAPRRCWESRRADACHFVRVGFLRVQYSGA